MQHVCVCAVCNGVADPLKHAPLHMWFRVEGCKHRGEPKSWLALELCLLGMGGMADPKSHPLPHTCYLAKCGRSSLKCVGIENPQNLEALGLHPLGVGGVALWIQYTSVTDAGTLADCKYHAYSYFGDC